MNRATSWCIRSLFLATVLCGVIGFSDDAHAQYKHFSLGGTLGFQMTGNQGGIVTADKGTRSEQGYGVGPSYLTIGAHGSWRFEDRFAVVFETHLSFNSCGFPNDVCDAGSTPLTLSVYTVFRIFFVTDSFRPYFDVGIGFWQSLAFVNTALTSFGPVGRLGFEWFFAEELALGIQVGYGLQLVVGTKGIEPFHNLHAAAVFTAYL